MRCDKLGSDLVAPADRDENVSRPGKHSRFLLLVEFLAADGYDVRYGARPLQRKLEALVTSPLWKFLEARPEVRDAELIGDRDETGAVVFRVDEATVE